MLGILDYLENEVLLPLGYRPHRIGSSGGTLSSYARTLTPPGENAIWWLEKAAEVSGAAKVGGTRTPLNLWNLCVHGGLLASKDVVPLVKHIMEGPQVNGSTAACMFSITSRYEARVRLDGLPLDQIAKFISASMSLQVAVSPTEILNRDLPLWLQEKWGVVDYPDSYSACSDGGTGSYLPVSLRGLHWDVPEGTPVIGVSLDPVGAAQYRPDGLTGSVFNGGNPFKKIWRGCWSVVGANANEDWEKAVADNDVYPACLLSFPTPDHLAKYELRLDTTISEAMEMYEYGLMEVERRVQFPSPGTRGLPLVEFLESL